MGNLGCIHKDGDESEIILQKCGSRLPHELKDELPSDPPTQNKRRVLKPILKNTGSKESSDVDRLENDPQYLAQ